MVETLGDAVVSYKIGLQLLALGGTEFGRELKRAGKNVFLDFKLHDIGTTVEKATRSITETGADLLTVHATPDVMAAVVRGRGDSALKIMAVTVLTSLDDASLYEMGYFNRVEELVMHRVRQAVQAGVDGVISSPLEAEKIRANVPKNFLIVTPGVRLPKRGQRRPKTHSYPQRRPKGRRQPHRRRQTNNPSRRPARRGARDFG